MMQFALAYVTAHVASTNPAKHAAMRSAIQGTFKTVFNADVPLEAPTLASIFLTLGILLPFFHL